MTFNESLARAERVHDRMQPQEYYERDDRLMGKPLKAEIEALIEEIACVRGDEYALDSWLAKNGCTALEDGSLDLRRRCVGYDTASNEKRAALRGELAEVTKKRLSCV